MFAIIRIIQLITLISSDYCPSWDIGNARFSPTQGSFRSLQLFGAGTHQVSWCSADILQSVSCKKVLRQSPTGPCLYSAARNRQWYFCCVARYSLVTTVCPSIAPVFSLCSDGHWIQVLRLCTCVDNGIYYGNI